MSLNVSVTVRDTYVVLLIVSGGFLKITNGE